MKVQSSGSVVGYLTAVFVVGLAIGGMTGYTVGKRAPARLPSEREAEAAWLAKYKSELALTDDQVRAVRPLLQEPVEALGGIWYRAIMTMGAVGEGVDRKIEPLLDHEQRRKLVAYIQKGREARLRIARAKLPGEAEGDGDLWTAARNGDLPAIRQCLEAGADVNQPDLGFRLTPLTTAAIHGRTEAVDLILQEGADVNGRSPDGNTALHGAAFFGRADVVRRLLEGGADATVKNADGRTPLEGMVADWETIQFFAAILQVELDAEAVQAGREAASQILGAVRGPRLNETDPAHSAE